MTSAKDFDSWNQNKKRIHTKVENKLYHAREIWWCSLGVNVGFEQDGSGAEYQRPVLILAGMSRETCYIVPLTSSIRRHRLRFPIGLVEGKQASALMSQIRLVDTKRLVNKVGFLNQETFIAVKKAAKNLF